MAVSNQEIIYTVKADTGEIEKALETVSKDAEKTSDSIDDVGKSMDKTGDATNILTDKLDTLTGGAISGFKNAATSTKSFITGLKLTRAAIIATGIGALVVGIVALVQQFNKTEEGARKLAKAFAPVRAVIDVLQQKISALGGAIFKLFTGDFRGAADDFTRALSNQNNEYERQIDLYRELVDREQALEDARIRQTVATAKTRAEIKQLNLVAEDLTKSIDEREAAAARAGQLERELFEERRRIAEEELAIAQARIESSNTTTEDREKAAELEAEIFRLEQESLELQTTLNNKLNTIRAEGLRQQQEQLELLKETNSELQEGRVKPEQIVQEQQQERELVVSHQNVLTGIEIDAEQMRQNAIRDRRENLKDTLVSERDAIVGTFQGAFNAISALQDAFGTENEKKARRNFKIQKALSLTQTTLATVEGVQNAFTTGQKSPITAVFPGYPFLQAGIAATFGAAQLAIIAKSKFQGGSATPPSAPSGGGGGGVPSGGGGQSQAPQLDLSFLGEGAGQEGPIQAYVVSENVSNAQQANQKIKEQAAL